MTKYILTGVDGNLGGQAAEYLMKLTDKSNVVFCGYSEESLKKYQDMGIDTKQTDFNHTDGLVDSFKGGDALALISMPFVGEKRRQAQKNVIDAAKKAGVKKIIYTSLVNAGDPMNPSKEKIDHAYTENYIENTGLDYIMLRNSQYAEAMITNYFTFVNNGGLVRNNQGDGKMAYISRKDCAKAVAYALLDDNLHYRILNINGAELMNITKFIEIGNEATGNHVSYEEISDEENYAVFDKMGVPRTTDGEFQKHSSAPFSSEGMVTFGQAIHEGKMDMFTDDFKKLTGDDPITVKYMFEHSDSFQIGDRHSKDS